jgi:sarcosine/dimethylglycine N-methyltransferase
MSQTEVVETARVYYNSDDADNFYHEIWGGEDIHVGIYEPENRDIFEASKATVMKMLAKLPSLDGSHKILDLGAGYGGAARLITQETQSKISCLNLSEVQNTRNREKNKAAQLDHLIEVVDGSFEELPWEAKTFDVVWSEDSFLHSGKRAQVLQEAHRVLKSGGHLIFTDPMQSENPGEMIKLVYKRIHLESMGSFKWYRDNCERLGFEAIEIEDLTQHLIRHYSQVRKKLEAYRNQHKGNISSVYLENMLSGLENWITAGNSGDLNWGILHFKKR